MIGVLLVNLGTPEAPTTPAVADYLREFLMDEYVIDIPYWKRWLLVHGIIAPFRSPKSARAYQKIWTPFGSPLLVNGKNLTWKVEEQLEDGYAVALAMRYGSPSVRQGLEELSARGVTQLIVMPLYPQMATSSYESSRVRVKEVAGEMGLNMPLIFVPPFYNHNAYINAVASRVSESVMTERPDYVLFSYHGLPERQVKRVHPDHCLKSLDCCARITKANQNCYRAQCFETTRLVATRTQLPPHSVSFQSRLGRNAWILPSTETELVRLAKSGVKKICVASPAFVADCLETLEEISIRARELFVANGGQDLKLIPSLNDGLDWVRGVAKIIHDAGLQA